MQKRYVIAGLGAVAAFSMSAFAASMVVDGGVLEAGSDTDLTCQGTDVPVDVSYLTSTDGAGHWIGAVNLKFDPACAGNYAHVEGQKQTGTGGGDVAFSAIERINNSGWATVDLPDGPVRADTLNRVHVLVKDKLVGGESDGWQWIP